MEYKIIKKVLYRILVIAVIFALLTTGVNNISQPDTESVVIGLIELVLVVCFIIVLISKLNKKLNKELDNIQKQNPENDKF